MASDAFNGFIGNARAVEALGRSLSHGRLSHAYLFVGPEGVGKTLAAERLISEAVGAEGRPWQHPDVMRVERLVDPKTGKRKTIVSVDQVRKLRERLSLSSQEGARKVAFIEEADRLGSAGSNALLKTLEEPSGDALIILRATDPGSLPATIPSRCQVMRFHSVPAADIVAALAKAGVGGEEAEEIAALSMGRPGWAFRLLRDGAFRAGIEVAASALASLADAPLAERFRAAGELVPKDEADKPARLAGVIDGWERLLRDLLLVSVGCDDLAVHASEAASLAGLARSRGPAHWQSALSRLREARAASRHHANPQLVLEHVLIGI